MTCLDVELSATSEAEARQAVEEVYLEALNEQLGPLILDDELLEYVPDYASFSCEVIPQGPLHADGRPWTEEELVRAMDQAGISKKEKT